VYFAMENAWAVTKQDGDQFITTRVNASNNNWLNTLCFIRILIYSTTLLSIFIKVRNVNLNFYLRINECLLTKNIYLVWYTSVSLFYSLAPKFEMFLWTTWYWQFERYTKITISVLWSQKFLLGERNSTLPC